MTSANGRSTSPARSTSAMVVAIVVPCVSTERGSVSLIDRLRISYRFWRRNLRRFSRTRSKMMIVSFSEYPTMVSTAPTTTRLTSRSRYLMKAMVVRMSWNVASTAARPKRHSNRNARYTRDDEREEDREERLALELASHLRADRLRADDRKGRGRRSQAERQGGEHGGGRRLGRPLGGGSRDHDAHSIQEHTRPAELLDVRIPDSRRVEGPADPLGAHGLRRPHLDERTAGERVRVVQPVHQKQGETGDDDRRREPVGPPAPFDEIVVGVGEESDHLTRSG